MAKSPLVSVIIPTYNRSRMVQRAIRSVLNQTMPQFELIIVDDGSTDNTQDVLATYTDPRISVYVHPENLGCSTARNTGWQASKGKFIAFLDSDDAWLPKKLEKQLALFAKTNTPELGAVSCGVLNIQEDVAREQVWLPQSKGDVFEVRLGLREYYDTASVWLIKRKYIERLDPPFDPQMDYAQVSDFLVRLSRLCHFDFVSEPLVRYYDHNQPPRNQLFPLYKKLHAYSHYIEKHRAEFERYPVAYSNVLTIRANRYLDAGDLAMARQDLTKAIRLHPGNRRAWVLLMAALLGKTAFSLARKIRRKVTRGRLNRHKLLA